MGVLQIGISAMVIENKVKTLTITTFLFPAINVLHATASPEYTMSSPNHPTSDIEDAFSSNFHDYFLATSRNISSDFLENSKNDEIPPVFSSFYNNPYLKDMQAFFAKESPIPPPNPITPPVILTLSLVLPPSPLFDP
nr:hypothetical protein [Tanacetum cinerariifolium]